MNEEKKRKLIELKEKVGEFSCLLAPIYDLLLWTWSGEIPDANRIESQTLKLIDDLIQHNSDFIGSGGIVIKYNPKAEDWQLLFQVGHTYTDFLKEEHPSFKIGESCHV